MVMATSQLTPEDLQKIYAWVDEIPLSRPKKNITRDFSDGVMMAELVYHYFPRLVELHNYSSASGMSQKTYNWNTLNQKVFRRLGFHVTKADVDEIANCVPGAIERVLRSFMLRLSKMKQRNLSGSGRSNPEEGELGTSQEMGLRSPAQQEYHNSGSSHSNNNNNNNRPASAQMGSNSGESLRLKQQLVDKEETIRELRETIDILEIKVQKLEQLVRLKDTKITALTEKLQKK